jgi:hypothetical protein
VDDRPWAVRLELDSWGEPLVARLGEIVDPAQLPGLVAFMDGRRVGLASYGVRDDVMRAGDHPQPPRRPRSRASLLDAVRDAALEAG